MNIIELENGLKFMILSNHIFNGKKYLFLVSVSDAPEYLFAEFLEDGQLIPVEDEALAAELMELAADKADEILAE